LIGLLTLIALIFQVVVLFQYNFKLVSEARNLNSIVVIEPWYDSGYWAL
jgi:hypothetical protein